MTTRNDHLPPVLADIVNSWTLPAAVLVREPCPMCPDGYVWTTDGPTDAECPTCRGKAYILTERAP